MIFSSQDLRELIVADTLNYLNEWSQSAENLLVGTAIQESGLGFELKSGSGLGIYHISTASHRAVWDHYLVNYPDKASRVRGLAGQHSFIENPHKELLTNLRYTTAIAWFIYAKSGCTLPEPDDIPALASIWHNRFRSKPHGNTEEFITNYRELGRPRSSNAA